MNKEEKKAFLGFLTIYITSTIFLLGTIIYIYYMNEVKSLKNSCSMELYNSSMKIKSEIVDKYIKNEKFKPIKLDNVDIKYALFDKNKNIIFSYLDEDFNIDFTKKNFLNSKYNYFITTINEDEIEIKYIVMESCQEYNNIINLKYIIISVLVFSVIFIGFIGYLLSLILLKPIRKRVLDMDKFIKDSAHELNTPITVLLSSVSMLKNGKNPEKMMKYISSSSKQISQIYNDIQFATFNEFKNNHIITFDLRDLLVESIDFFTDIAVLKNIEIIQKLDTCIVKMDKTKAQRVLNNLISNAIKYSKKDSKINIELNNSILMVEDFGIGIKEDEIKEIFLRYKRGQNSEGGFGIGLDIVKTICQEYNLVLNLESKEKIGSKFFIDFSNVCINI
ncbi:HAMP domain-containing histidine kinase [Aliarcobacter cibarius]|uniref:histidine kinase n=1 Tax=Aliarcobacter cibarius TaxID=255507 RepID=A0ABY2V2E6_9BACT|nr:HAMP domain-containing histidine kinase [Aliarcobacter cibarius]TLS96815.1 HAMP domain-containing histidine kinase [Aliarcobacter cibarius]TLT02949.1 HAMP domain-containing histidine kinase [Aliarcobacter cibarius]